MEHPNIFSDGCPQSTEKPKMNNGKVGITSSLYFFSTHEKACEVCNWNSKPCHWFPSILKVTQDGITSGWKQKYDLRRPKKNMTFGSTSPFHAWIREAFLQIAECLEIKTTQHRGRGVEPQSCKISAFSKDGVDWCTHHRLFTTTLNPQSKTRFLLIATGLLSRHQRVLQLSPTANEDLGSDGGCCQWLPSTGVMSCETTKNEQFHIETSQIGNAKDWNLPSMPLWPLALESTFPSILLCLESIIVYIYLNLYTVHQYFVHPNHSIPV